MLIGKLYCGLQCARHWVKGFMYINSSNLHNSTGQGRGCFTGISARGSSKFPHVQVYHMLTSLCSGSYLPAAAALHTPGATILSQRGSWHFYRTTTELKCGAPLFIRGTLLWHSQWAAPREQLKLDQAKGKKRFRLYFIIQIFFFPPGSC